MNLDTASVKEFFREKVEAVQRKQHVTLQDGTQFYVVNLLSDFVDAARLHAPNVTANDEPLAITFVKALNSGSTSEQFQLYKSVGDRSLYVSGFFADSFNRKIFDVDYYISMGGTAYGSASQLNSGLSETFVELAQKFPRLVDVISEISEDAGLTSNSDLLRLYERWLKTKSDRLSEKLREQGIAPIVVGTEPIH